jgi:hypothetical protein
MKKLFCYQSCSFVVQLAVGVMAVNQRPHQGRWCDGKTPMQPFIDSIPPAKEKMIAA